MSDPGGRLFREWIERHAKAAFEADLRTHGTEEQRAEWREHSAVTDELERRVRAVEGVQAKLVDAVADLKAEAHETRTEQTAMLKEIRSDLKAVAEKQTFDAGLKAGAAGVVAFVKWAIGLTFTAAIGVLVFAAYSFVEDVRAPQEINETIEDAR
jgi:hypothetical protein